MFRVPELDLVTIYTCYVRPICEYAVPVWNPGLTKNQSSRLETIQRRACRIILGKKYTHYSEALTQLGLPTLESRREQLCKKFGLKLLKSAFRDWLPQSRGETSDGSCSKPSAPTNGYIKDGTIHNSLGYVKCNLGHPGYYLTSSPDTHYRCYGGYRYPTYPSATCTQLCSWRPDSKFCYPGNCTDSTPSSCTCAPGFSGNNCLKSAVTRSSGSIPCEDNGISQDNPTSSMHDCTQTEVIPVTPQHGDSLYFTTKSTNGGYVKVRNYDGESGYTVNPPVYFSGREVAYNASFTFDLEPPYHCSLSDGCTDNMLDRGPAITKDGNINLRWSGWRDDGAGIGEYEYEVFLLVPFGEELREHRPALTGQKVTPDITEANVVLNETGVYSIVLTVEDSCGPDNGNFISARRFLIFDNSSTVEVDTSGRYPMWVVSSNSTWQTDLQDSAGNGTKVRVKWPGHFFNKLHRDNKFLNNIKEHQPPITTGYEELTGLPPATRSREAIPNVNGIVVFQTCWAVDDHGGRSLTCPPGNWSNVTDVLMEQEDLDIVRQDGDTIRVWVRAFDVMGNVAEDSVIFHVDSSPPTVEDVSLSRHDVTGLAVHNSEDLFNMTVVFTAFDDHSGLHDIHWQLHDMADPRLVHGEGQVAVRKISIRSSSVTILRFQVNESECSPPLCTCIPKDMECYIRNYQFELDEDKMNDSLGTHDFDYHFVITVTNNAMLQTQKTFQVTVDASPPLPGHVHDSLPGETDTDYQQDGTIHASWAGFLDRESGVMFYLVSIAQTCTSLDNMTSGGNDSFSANTTSTYTTWEIPHPGTYYCTVVAFNRALEPSDPVCSDGVTVDTTPPVLTEVVVDSAHFKPGLLRDGDGNVWLVDRNGYRQPDPGCGNVSRQEDDIEIWPLLRMPNGTALPGYTGDSDCDLYEELSIKTYVSQENMLSVHWYGEDQESDIYDYEVGLSSSESPDLPDILPLTSTNSRPHFSTYHPNLGEGKQFYLVIRAVNRAQIVTTKVLGPYIVDVTPPTFSGQVEVTLEQQDGHQVLVGRWEKDAFFETDGDDGLLLFEFAVGHSPGSSEVHPFTPLPATGTDLCNVTFPPSCVCVRVSSLDWQLHGTHAYYMSVRAENTAGLSLVVSSGPYVHVIDVPSKGVVMEVSDAQREASVFGHEGDIDFQNTTEQLHCEWWGFSSSHLSVTYQVGVGTTPGTDDVISFADAGMETHFTWNHLHLQRLQVYYVTVIALTDAGNTTVTSDGVRVVVDDDVINGTTVFDGAGCRALGYNTTFSHHADIPYGGCADDIDYQASLTAVSAHWSVADDIRPFVRHIEWALEREDAINGATIWEKVTDFRNVQMSPEATWTSLRLTSGDKYRSVVRLCHTAGCFKPVFSDGFRVLHEAPIPGQITDIHYNSTASALTFTWERFTHGHVTPGRDSYMLGYEWTLSSEMSSQLTGHGDVILPWQNIEYPAPTGSRLTYMVTFDHPLDPTHCLRLLVRGYNKAGLSSLSARDVINCDTDNPADFRTPLVIDAVGEYEQLSPSHTSDIYLETNQRWPLPDKEFTPASAKLSAVWPTLRHGLYNWKVISADSIRHWAYVTTQHALRCSDYECGSPEVLACGTTKDNFVNVPGLGLRHGRRYHLCVHADQTVLQFETFDQTLVEVDTCSNGVTVDLTPPSPGQVWVNRRDQDFQTSTSELYVFWDSFADVEDHGMSSHRSGIQKYELAIGSSRGGEDIEDFKEQGVTNMAAMHHLHLQQGHTYYATIRATDYVGFSVTSVSQGVTIDVTAPMVTEAKIDVGGRYHLSTSSVTARWDGVFLDPESGISHYEWSVGSGPGHADIMPFTRTESEAAVSDPALDLQLQEGHVYFVSVKAYNGAGLSVMAVSWPTVVDSSPPEPGVVYDGLPSPGQDADFQTELDTLHASWTGFRDAHTAIMGYGWSVGTCPGCDDVMEAEHVGLLTDVSASHLGLVPGKKYYVTVTACNAADLCTSVCSDGVIIDNSPPAPGVVYDGVDDMDSRFQALRTTLGAHWFGFHDPHSGLSHYEWRAGTTPGGDEVYSTTRLHLTELVHISQLDPPLPLNQTVYVTVRAYNKADLYVERTSNGFRIDESPPVMLMEPQFDLTQGSIVPNTQVWRTTLSVRWEVVDPESSIERQYLSVFTHHQAGMDMEPVEIAGSVRDYRFTNLSLHDGDTYYVRVVACNGAELCTSGQTHGVLVDSTPPTAGMLAVQTDHAAQLWRHRDGWMTYYQQDGPAPPHVRLAWLGFTDMHTGINNYHVTIGSTFGDTDLTRGCVVLPHQDGPSHEDEGAVQVSVVNITRDLADREHIYVTLWAVNKVGLQSVVAHEALEAVPSNPHSGLLSLVRRCDVHSCEGDCTCAPQNQKCDQLLAECHNVTNRIEYQQVLVYDLTDMRSWTAPDTDVTLSQCTLAARWETLSGGTPVQRFEWSAGQQGKAAGTGVLDGTNDRIWYDVGLRTSAVLSLRRDRLQLEPHVRYVFHVRAWYSSDVYLDFHSDGVITDFTPPAVSRSKKVEDIPDVGYTEDTDVTTDASRVAVGWGNMFQEPEVGVAYFQVSLSSFPGGEDIVPYSSYNISSTTSEVLIDRLTLQSGVEYFSNVRAYSHAGLHTTVSSDGFLVDTEAPSAGVVYDGLDIHDMDYQNCSSHVAASWHGFSDLQSYINHYVWCVGSTPGTDDILTCTDVGLRLSEMKAISPSLTAGTKYYSTVYAVDAAGLTSSPAMSDGILVDTTPPEVLSKFDFGPNLLGNPSFENIQSSANSNLTADSVTTGNSTLTTGSGSAYNSSLVSDDDVSNTSLTADNGKPARWNISGVAAVMSPSTAVSHHGVSYLLLHGSVSQLIPTSPGERHRLTLHASPVFPSNTPVVAQEGYVIGPGMHRVFKLYQRPSHLEGAELHVDRNITWHKHVFYFTAVEGVSEVVIGSVGPWSGITLDDVKVQEMRLGSRLPPANPSPTNQLTSPVHLETSLAHGWTSVHAAWDCVDTESPIVDYSWAIGTVRGGTQLQDFKTVGRNTHAQNEDARLNHGSFVHVTVVAENEAALRSVAYSDPILVDLTPPVISVIKDGGDEEDVDFQQSDVITLHWNVTDDESGVDFCEVALGLSPGSGEVHQFTQQPSLYSATFDLSGHLTHSNTVYSTLRCHNYAGMTSHLTSDGVTIVTQPPNSDHAIVETMSETQSYYPSRAFHQSTDDVIHLSWGGFFDVTGIRNYQCRVTGPGLNDFPWIDVGLTGQTHATLSGLQLHSYNRYDVHVRAVNHGGMVSDDVTSDIYVEIERPLVMGKFRSWWPQQGVMVFDWTGVFLSNSSLVYEVSMGTKAAGTDVMQWRETEKTEMRLDGVDSNREHHVVITAVNQAGLCTTGSFVLSYPGSG
ncbi:Hypp2286 [Branchiostoma lanceolatum]|uniref:Hypp2286 protein n=1 Tax=Branchiostoma lanceolatum TaxID=7740 RepID=A0A8J9ZPR9_BRALA|nr:Hypp2286 [Branchiostoma lanceolatum]